jgi:uncharacterized sulfatase
VSKRPNILLITSDQQHYRTLGCQNPELKTPALDQLAQQGTLFSRAYCPNPTCTPTRASIITGQYPSQHGAWTLGTKLNENSRTIGQYFTEAGYRTALVGKAHFQPLRANEEYASLESYPIMQDLEYWRQFHGPFYGFEQVELARNHGDESHVGQHYAIWMEESGCMNWRDYFRPPTGTNTEQTFTWLIPERFHYNAWIAEKTNQLLEGYAKKGESFLLWSSFFDPHPPYLAPEPWDRMYDPSALTVPRLTSREHEKNPPHFGMTQDPKADWTGYRESGFALHGMHHHHAEQEELKKQIAVYYGMVSLLDKYIGLILQKLQQLGLAQDTMLIFTTDHGHFFGQHGLLHKGPFHYEDMIRIPFIARFPGRVTQGRVSAALVSLVDLAPTFLRAAGLPVPRTMTGVDQLPAWCSDTQVRDHVLVENHHDPTSVHLRTYVDERYKLTVYYRKAYGELFDLQADPDELNNRWDDPQSAGLKSDLLLKLAHAEMGREPMWMPRIAHA